MEARVITKNVEIEGRRFVVKKYTAMDGLKIAKLILAKILPAFQDFVHLAKDLKRNTAKTPLPMGGGEEMNDESNEITASEIIDNLSLDTIAAALDKITGDDLDYIIKKSLQSVEECLPAGNNPVMYDNGFYGVADIEYDPLMVMRLTCEAVMWSCGSFFDGNRLNSVMKPLFTGSQQSR